MKLGQLSFKEFMTFSYIFFYFAAFRRDFFLFKHQIFWKNTRMLLVKIEKIIKKRGWNKIKLN